MRVVGIITLFLVILKITNIIAWEWVWVVSPMWIVFIVGIFILFINDIVEDRIERKRSDEEGAE